MLFVHCKDTNLKAIHNTPLYVATSSRLFVHCKDTNLKAIHNSYALNYSNNELFVHCKDTNLKAIHNRGFSGFHFVGVVRALQRY